MENGVLGWIILHIFVPTGVHNMRVIINTKVGKLRLKWVSRNGVEQPDI